ncbi:ECSIT [Bugula neritina]|uniref:Evolutionarily conserved signaling intermediate in Toll pathway, mitochondrial n=1 Tax=Bugula neritina TaxID=10212 RepID=A0A7J7JA10_BUGNE|nr:ECSIT [Bugula neritina]
MKINTITWTLSRLCISPSHTLSILSRWTSLIIPVSTASKIFTHNFHTAKSLAHRDGTVQEIQNEKIRKRRELAVFYELSELRKAKDKDTYRKALEIYMKKQSVYRRGHVDFILGAIEQMKEYQVHKDVEAYKALMRIFPEGELLPKSIIQSEFMHYPRQQNTAIDILSAMGNNGCIPDDEIGNIIVSRFGENSYVMKKYQRIMYWGPKFRNMNPYPVPWILPQTKLELAVMALKRMAVDKNNVVKVYDTNDLSSTISDGFIASACSPTQQELMRKHNSELPLYVEGGFTVWMREESLVYFILRADPHPDIVEYNQKCEEDEDDISSGFYTYLGADDEEKRKKSLIVKPSVHEQPEGTILAMCITETSNKDSLVDWINFLQVENSCLSKVPILFSLKTPESGLQSTNEDEKPREELNPGES